MNCHRYQYISRSDPNRQEEGHEGIVAPPPNDLRFCPKIGYCLLKEYIIGNSENQ